MDRPNLSYFERVRQKYNDIDEIWEKSDRWHLWSRRQIEAELSAIERPASLSDESIIVDIGSAGDSYSLSRGFRIDVDLAERSLAHCRHPICANAEMLPLACAIADLTICVGPVINYCSMEEVIRELAHVTKIGGYLVLHVDLSNSGEFLGSKAHRSDASFVTSFYKGAEQYWVYSDNFTRRMLANYGFVVERVRYIHILSSLAYRLSGLANLSSYLAVADRLLCQSFLSDFAADSAIYVCCRAAKT